MGIVLNEGQVMLRAIPSLNNARNDLQEASNDARSLLHKLPSSFSQRGLVSDIANKLSNAKGEVDSAKSLVNSKVSTAKSIEGKNSAKASLLALLLGAKGGFVTGATTANKARGVKSSSYSRTGAATANKSNNIFSKIFGGIKKAGSALFSGGKTVVKWLGNTTKAVINIAKSVGTKIASGTKSIIQRIVPSTKQVIETVKKVGTKIIDGVKTVGKWAGKTANTIVSGAKSIGTKIVNGFKTVGRWAGDAAKNISKVVKKVGATAAQCVSDNSAGSDSGGRSDGRICPAGAAAGRSGDRDCPGQPEPHFPDGSANERQRRGQPPFHESGLPAVPVRADRGRQGGLAAH